MKKCIQIKEVLRMEAVSMGSAGIKKNGKKIYVSNQSYSVAVAG